MRFQRLVLQDVGPFDKLDLEFDDGTDPEKADVHLLIGPNGTGKSTVLRALAQILTNHPTSFGLSVRSDRAFALCQDRAGRWCGWRRGEREASLATTEPPLHLRRVANDLFGTPLQGVFHLIDLSGPELLNRKAVFEDGHGLAFSYGGQRHVDGGHLEGPKALQTNPLSEATDFNKVINGSFAQWALNQITAGAVSQQRGNQEGAARANRTLNALTAALSKVTGRTVAIDVADSVLDVVVRLDGDAVPLGQLPAGLGALLAWLGDLLMRLDRLPWKDDADIDQREFILLLDEVEVHLHPAWQRKVIPMVERLFPKAQIIAATHSPFVIQSASDAWIHRFELEDGKAVHAETIRGPLGMSYPTVLRDIMGIESEFSPQAEALIEEFRVLRNRRLHREDVDSEINALAARLRGMSEELQFVVEVELRQLKHLALPAKAAGT